jgi:hypothetical protein
MSKSLSLLSAIAVGSAIAWAQAPTPPATTQAPPKLAPGAVPAGFDGSAYTKAREISARIMSFTVEPNSIQPGQSAVLKWGTENPAGVTLDPAIGRVLATGSQIVKPNRTTTYTLTVRGGANNTVLTRSVTVNVAGTTALAPDVAAAGSAATQAVPRLNGKPDLSGVYGAAPNGGGRGGTPAGDGPVLKPGAEKFRVVRPANDTGFFSDCMPVIPPQGFGVYEVQIIQGANSVAILNEFPGTFRAIPTHGGPQPADPGYSWQGNSIGHWEGDTLVVDTRGFNEKTEIQGFRHTDELHIIERFTRPEFGVLKYETTVEDPNVWVKPWTTTKMFAIRPDLERVGEFVCENNRDYRPLFGTK